MRVTAKYRSGPARRHSVLLFSDGSEDPYTTEETDDLVERPSEEHPGNQNVVVNRISIPGDGFLRSSSGHSTSSSWSRWISAGTTTAVPGTSYPRARENSYCHSATITAEAQAA